MLGMTKTINLRKKMAILKRDELRKNAGVGKGLKMNKG
jgi:hypothetical protein